MNQCTPILIINITLIVLEIIVVIINSVLSMVSY